MKKRRLLGLFAAFAMLTSTMTPVYANQVDLDVTSLLDNAVTLGFSANEDELLEDEVIKKDTWYEWDADNGVLTLKGQLPNIPYKSIANIINIDPESIKTVIISKNTKANENLNGAFYQCKNLTTIKGIANLDISATKNIGSMFFNCSSLTSLDLSSWDTSNVTSMSGMFSGCSALTSLNVSTWDTSNVSYSYPSFSLEEALNSDSITPIFTSGMDSMFFDCKSLESLDLSGWDTSKNVSMYLMFGSCKSLKQLDLSGWDTSNVKDMAVMFEGCNSLESLNLSGWDTSNVISMRGMFIGNIKLNSLDVSHFNTGNVIDMREIFRGCSSLKSLNLSGWNTTNVKKNEAIFEYMYSLESIKLPKDYSVTSGMHLPNKDDIYKGWAKKGTSNIISGDKEDAVFTTDKAGEYVRTKGTASTASPTITKIEPGNGKMNVAWQAVPNATSYKVYYKTGSTTKSTSRTGTGALISGISNGTYDVWVTATVNGKETTQKNIKKAAVKGYYVTCKTTSGMIAGGIKIDWNKYDGATKYRVVCIDKDNKVVGTAETTALTYQWKGLKNNTEYGFYVQPFINGVYPTFTRTDANDKRYIQWTIPVNAPMITKLSLGNQKLWLYYESVPRATKYYIYYKQKGDSKDTLAVTTTNTKFLVTGIKNNVSTEFYVKALVDGKLTPLKRPATRTTRAGMKPTITVTAGQAALKWSKYTDCKASATKYKVVFVDANYKTIDYRETTNLSFTWKSSALKKGTKYGFYVVPYVNGEYIPFGLSYANDKANVVMFTAK